ncbi:MAG: fibronectin type III domain-containing protein, partial [Minisyncoccota bacterium]
MKLSLSKVLYTSLFALSVVAGSIAPLQSASASTITTPLVLYTDILSGPNSGGENNQGAYLSIFGKNFGTTGLGTTVKVYINNVEVNNYRYLGVSKGRPDIQQITVQVGALGNPTPGAALPIKVVVNGVSSNTDKTFIVNPGRILFVDNVSGNDSTAIPNDITHPYQNVQTGSASAGAYGAVQPGDIIVMRGTGTAYNTVGLNNSFLRFLHKAGTQPTGAAGTGPITLMSYPGEDAFILNTSDIAISGVDRSNSTYQDGGAWITISGLRIEGDGKDGVINMQIASDHWRIVNNDLSSPGAGSITVLAGGITGNGTNTVIYGNQIHNILGAGGESHGVYVDGDGSYDIGYNNIHDVDSGYGIQAYNAGSNGSSATNNFSVHHNLVHDINGKSGINIADGSTAGFKVWDNIIYNTNNSGIRFNSSPTLIGAQVYNNIFYNADLSGRYSVVQNDWNAMSSSQLSFKNNIVWATSGGTYIGGTFGAGIMSNNLWYGVGGTPSEDTNGISANPAFVSAGSDFHLTAGSPAIDAGSSAVSSLVTDDYDTTTPRPQPPGGAYDIGAYEYVSAGGGTTDTTPPSTPTGLSATVVSSSQINLSWTASTDNVGVTGYKIYRNGTQVTTTTGTTYNDTGLTASTLYSYTVSAYDAAGNNSAQSTAASATTQATGSCITSSTTWQNTAL